MTDVKINDLTVAFGSRVILKDFDLEFHEGQIIGLVAPNGTGKTTLIRALMNYLQPKSGNIEINGLKYKSQKNETELHRQMIAFPDQDSLFQDLSGLAHLNLYADLWQGTTWTVAEIIERLNMGAYVKRPVRSYSLGMKQRLAFAMMLAADTPIMLMDEIMNGLDPTNVRLISAVLEDLRQQGKLIIIASHLLNNLTEYADRVLFIQNAEIVEDLIMQDVAEKLYVKIALSVTEFAQLSPAMRARGDKFPNDLYLFPVTVADELAVLAAIRQVSHARYEVAPLGLGELYDKYFLD